MNNATQALIEESTSLNREITEKCLQAEKIIKDITLAYKKPVSENSPFVVSFTGRFKTGKSSLINALLGADILPTKATTATSIVTRIFYGETPRCRVVSEMEDKEISIEEGKDMILNYKVTDTEKPVEVIFEMPVPWLKNNIELRDTPGMDDSSQNGKLEKIALNALKDTDLCVCVYDACTMISEKERSRTQRIYSMMSGNLIYAVNCTNRLNSLESLNDVKKIADNFFGKMQYSVPGMGRYYMMCSAPGMVALGGFDKWLQDFVSKANLQTLNQVRKSTGTGQLNVFRKDFASEAQHFSEQLTQQLSALNEKHEEIIRQTRKNDINAAQNDVEVFNRAVVGLANNFTDTSFGLRDRIQACKSNNKNNYAINTKTETVNYFIERYKNIIGNYGNYFSKNDVQFIQAAFAGITFPETHTIISEATKGEKRGWTIAGTVIGTIIAPGVGSLIGAALGRGIGGANNTTDDSVDNTMNFIRNSVVPLINTTINAKISDTRRSIRNNVNQNCTSGLEDMISQTIELQKQLNEYHNAN